MTLLCASRDEARSRLTAYLPAVARYAAERNYAEGGRTAASGLSPALRRRLVSEEEVVAAVLERHGLSLAEKFVQEVCWRTYWKGWLEQRPAAWSGFIEACQRYEEDLGQFQRRQLEAVLGQRCEIACMNAWVGELISTGYLHNHVRMWFASIWIFTLRLPWELGARLFWEHLLDADAASNTLSWRWVAGLHTPGKTYLARPDNIAHYTRGRHEPVRGQLAAATFALPDEPLPRVSLPDPESLPSAAAGTGLWLHGDDCTPETSALRELRPAAIAWWSPEGVLPRAELALAQARAAEEDCVVRATPVWGRAPKRLPGEVGQLAAWARSQGLRQIVALRPFVGPVLDALEEERPALAAAGVELRILRRPWDQRSFPHAGKGFFNFWQKTQRGLESDSGH